MYVFSFFKIYANPHFLYSSFTFIYRNGCATEVRRNIKDGKNKNEHIKEIMGVKGKPDIIHIKQKKRLQWYGHVKRKPEERTPN